MRSGTKILLFLSALGVLALIGLTLLNVLFSGLGEGDEKWSRDYRPEGIYLEDLIQKGYPSSIYRVVEAGELLGFLGDGVVVEVFCFRESQLEEMKAFLINSDKTIGEWQSGLPQSGYWGSGDNFIPKDLRIPSKKDPLDYIHYNMSPGSGRSLIIDTKRFIAYKITVYT